MRSWSRPSSRPCWPWRRPCRLALGTWRRHAPSTQKGTAAYALNHYAAAAEYFEKAFEIRPDPALLYNAAQAHRLAGNKERALSLYESYLHVYGKATPEKRGEIEGRVRELKKAIAHGNAATSPPPGATAPVAAPTPAPAPPLAPAAAVKEAAVPAPPAPAPTTTLAAAEPGPAPAPVLIAQAAPAADSEPPLTRRPWFWVVTGGAVAVAAAAVLALSLRGSSAASPSAGKVDGN